MLEIMNKNMKGLPNPVGALDHSSHVKKWTTLEATAISLGKAQAMREKENIRDLLVSCRRRHWKPLDEVCIGNPLDSVKNSPKKSASGP